MIYIYSLKEDCCGKRYFLHSAPYASVWDVSRGGGSHESALGIIIGVGVIKDLLLMAHEVIYIMK